MADPAVLSDEEPSGWGVQAGRVVTQQLVHTWTTREVSARPLRLNKTVCARVWLYSRQYVFLITTDCADKWAIFVSPGLLLHTQPDEDLNHEQQNIDFTGKTNLLDDRIRLACNPSRKKGQ